MDAKKDIIIGSFGDYTQFSLPASIHLYIYIHLPKMCTILCTWHITINSGCACLRLQGHKTPFHDSNQIHKMTPDLLEVATDPAADLLVVAPMVEVWIVPLSILEPATNQWSLCISFSSCSSGRSEKHSSNMNITASKTIFIALNNAWNLVVIVYNSARYKQRKEDAFSWLCELECNKRETSTPSNTPGSIF